MADDIVGWLRDMDEDPTVLVSDRRRIKAAADEIERLRAENERYEALFLNLSSIALDHRYSDEFVGQLTRSRIDALLAAATKDTADGR